MKGDTYYLKDIVGGYVLGKFVVREDSNTCVIGDCYEATGWGSNKEAVIWAYHSGVYCKWDACTHWHFYGEDYDPELNATDRCMDSYYHLCTDGGFTNHIRLMCFVWKIVSSIMAAHNEGEDFSNYIDIMDNYFDLGDTQKLVDLMFEGYSVDGIPAEGKE